MFPPGTPLEGEIRHGVLGEPVTWLFARASVMEGPSAAAGLGGAGSNV